MLTVLTSATDSNLTVRENVREALDFPDAKYDQYLDRLISRASDTIRTLIAPDLGVTRYQAVLPAYGGPILQLPAYPVRAVLRLFDGTDTGTSNELTATDYRLDQDRGHLYREQGWPWTRQIEPHAPADVVVPNGEYRNYLIEFGAGYTLPGGISTTVTGVTSTGPTVPGDLEEACIGLVRARFQTRTRTPGVISERVGDASVTYGTPGDGGLPSEVLGLLEPYRSV